MYPNLIFSPLTSQKIDVELVDNNTLILYQEENRNSAITLASYFRSNAMNIEMFCIASGENVEQYKSYGQRIGIGGILLMEDNDTIQIINLKENTVSKVKMADLIQ